MKRMDSKKAADILIKMLDNPSPNADQKEAILKAVGVLSWTMLSENTMKNRKYRSF